MSDENSDVLPRAEELLRGRLTAISSLEQAATELTDARVRVSAAEKQVSAAITAAQDVGWTTTELRQLGLPVPSRRSGGGNKNRRRPPATSSGTDS